MARRTPASNYFPAKGINQAVRHINVLQHGLKA